MIGRWVTDGEAPADIALLAGERFGDGAIGTDQFEAFKLLSLDEMGQTKIDFGSAHLGRTYSEMWEKETKYVKWFQASYHSSNKVNHQKFIHYISLRVTYAEHQLGLNSQDLQPSPSQRPLHPALKSKAKAKPIQEVTPQDLADLAEDESWEPVQEIEIQPEIYTEMAAFRPSKVRCRRSLPTSGLHELVMARLLRGS